MSFIPLCVPQHDDTIDTRERVNMEIHKTILKFMWVISKIYVIGNSRLSLRWNIEENSSQITCCQCIDSGRSHYPVFLSCSRKRLHSCCIGRDWLCIVMQKTSCLSWFKWKLEVTILLPLNLKGVYPTLQQNKWLDSAGLTHRIFSEEFGGW